jgi:hypothetical protein
LYDISSNTEKGKAKFRASLPVILLIELLVKGLGEASSRLYSYNHTYENGNVIK